MLKTLGDYLVLLLSILGSLASIIAFPLAFGDQLNNQGWVAVLFLGVISFIFLAYNFYLVSKHRKIDVYSEIFEDLNVGFSVLHRLDRGYYKPKTKEDEIQHILEKLTQLCESISTAFTKVNGHHIGVCIKYLTVKDNHPIVQTLVRDSKSSNKGRKSGSQDPVEHWLSENSDFDFIYRNFEDETKDTSFYYASRLPVKMDYRNTRLTNWPPQRALMFNKLIRRSQWPLKYRSTLVVPIVPISADEQKRENIRGFLCIDSPRETAFFPQVDVQILQGTSDGLYNKIDKLHVLTLESGNQS